MLQCYEPHGEWTPGCKVTVNLFSIKTEKQKKLISVCSCKSKSKLLPSDSFPLKMSPYVIHMCSTLMRCLKVVGMINFSHGRVCS